VSERDEVPEAVDTERELSRLDYYTLLGVARGVSDEDLRAAFRRFALRYHPDRFAAESAALAARALAIYRRGTEAFEVLSNDERRAAYDLVLARGEVRLSDDASALLRAAAAKGAPKGSGPEGKAEARPRARARSPQAKAFHDRALAALAANDLRAAWKMLHAAVEAEPGDAELERLLHDVAKRLRG
jgi:curved DNA-binding protein CbpA